MVWKLIECILICICVTAFSSYASNYNSMRVPSLKKLERKVSDTTYKNDVKQVANMIPEDLLIQMKDVQNVSEFLTRFVEGETLVSNLSTAAHGISLGSQSRKGLSAAAALHIAKYPGCKPKDEEVKLENLEIGGAFFWPPCVTLPRCGGCCTSKMLTCLPIQTSTINITAMQFQYVGGQSSKPLKNDGLRVFPMERHDRCSCSCREQAEHCSKQQKYRDNECRCVCPNQNEATTCTGPNSVWDNVNCLCACRTAQDCSTGFYFNLATCRCEALRESRIPPWRYAIGRRYSDVHGKYNIKIGSN